MKVIAKPTKNTLLMLDKGECLHASRPSLVSYSDYLTVRQTKGEIKILASDLPDTASDADFYKTWMASEKNSDLAIAAYLSELEVKPEESSELTEEQKKTAAAAAALSSGTTTSGSTKSAK